ncbi:hypothetical protein GCM10023086_20680 [Streptomyces venetus]|uniref:Tc1-like transposase DDE domain-containing protein n=1 Tax=Streptomyces venetus TaxID=1701086 RepID=A0ABP8FHD4_9ACTN
MRGRNRGRVNIAGVVCYRAGHRSRFFFKLHIRHGRRGEPKAFSWRQYRDLIVMTHLQLGTPVVWCRDNLNVHLVKEPADFAAADLTHLTRVIKRRLKKIQYRPPWSTAVCHPPV